jgi:hypothetical protein
MEAGEQWRLRVARVGEQDQLLHLLQGPLLQTHAPQLPPCPWQGLRLADAAAAVVAVVAAEGTQYRQAAPTEKLLSLG